MNFNIYCSICGQVQIFDWNQSGSQTHNGTSWVSSFCDLKNLNHLVITANKIKYLPENIGNLKQK